ncbi:MAG: TIGR00730 family Rossman fold protein [Acidobacteria bacterium]|nr:TIGR00730 family Rossman fold protein [Acidobacteriota bacterium]
MRRICVFCGSSVGSDPRYRDAAAEVGRRLASEGLGVVFGGGSIGLMGVLADATLAAGGELVGVIPHALAARELAHRGVPDMRVVPSMHARKALMAELSDAFIALPGGLGTFEELLEIATWGQLGIHHKPVGMLNVAGYYAPLITLLDHAVKEGFVSEENRRLIVVADSPPALLEELRRNRRPERREWITPDEA